MLKKINLIQNDCASDRLLRKHKGHFSFGFTLLEVVIAMTIISFASMQLYSVLQSNVSGINRLEQKTLAHFVAMNQWVEIEVNDPWPNVGTSEKSVENKEREWLVTTKVTNAPLPLVRQVEISVSLKSDKGIIFKAKDNTLARLNMVVTDKGAL